MKLLYNHPQGIRKQPAHRLSDVLFTALLSFLSSGKDYSDMVLFARQHEDFLKEFVPLENGIPSRDTFSRVFSVLEPDLFRRCLYAYRNGVTDILSGKKTEQGKKNTTIIRAGKNGPSVLQARVAEDRMCFVPKKSAKQAAESTSFLEGINIRNAVVIADVGDCQEEFASLIVRKGGYYFLSLKKEQTNLYNPVVCSFDFGVVSRSSEIREYDNGRFETRRCGIIDAKDVFPKGTPGLPEGMKTLIKTDSVSVTDGKDTRETHYHISNEAETAYINILMNIHGVTSSHPVNGKQFPETNLPCILFKNEPHLHITQEDTDERNARENLFFLKRFAIQINREAGILNRVYFNTDVGLNS